MFKKVISKALLKFQMTELGLCILRSDDISFVEGVFKNFIIPVIIWNWLKK